MAHIDHGKSTLADRMLDVTKTIEKRKMMDQVLDRMELERERGITIKMQPVRMDYEKDGQEYIFNLIDTPGHIDFSYEVSRALQAVEGSILLVDATQGVQAQTLTTLSMAKELGLTIIPVLSKIDSPLARIDDVKDEVVNLLDCPKESILEVSGKTGEGVEELLNAIIDKVPSPKIEFEDTQSSRALIFDFEYSKHKGIVVFVRVLDGSIKKGDSLMFSQTREKFEASEVGVFSPEQVSTDSLGVGQIGYIVTGIKKYKGAFVGDTITMAKNPLPPLPGYMTPKPVVWSSIYPESQDDFPLLKQSLERLKLTDPSISFEEETSGILGRGFRCGFLGMLHLEIITERLKREFGLELTVATPSTTYEIENNGKKEIIYTPSLFPDKGNYDKVLEPWVKAKIITPGDYMGEIMQLLFEHEAEVGHSDSFGENRVSMEVLIPLRELMRNFFDELKSASSGFASLSYEIGELRPADVARLDILVAEEVVPAFSRVVSTRKIQKEAEDAVERLYKVLPKQLFTVKIQGKGLGRIMSSKTLKAMKKDVTGHLYGGDITRKRKLWEKQKKGKKLMKERGKVNIPQHVFIKMMKEE